MKIQLAEVPVSPEQRNETSLWGAGLAVAMTLFLVGLTVNRWLAWAGAVGIIGSALAWVRENSRHYGGVLTQRSDAYPRHSTPEPSQEEGRSKWWWGTVALIVTEALLFLAAFLPHATHPILHDPGAPSSFLALNRPLALVASLVLWSSGVTAALAMRALRRDNLRKANGFLGATLALGLLFVLYQLNEYRRLYSEGFTISSGGAGGIFYALTGLHGLHVVAGLAALAIVLLMILLGRFSARRHAPAKAAILYWHFVDAVWIFIYGILYLKLL